MASELRLYNTSQQIYNQSLTSVYRNGTQVFDASVWLARDPDAEEKMLRDADISYAVSYRQALVAGRQWTLQPKMKGSPRADLSVDVGTQLLGDIKQFTAARQLLSRAFFHGQRCARIHGHTRRMTIGDGRERTWWLPTRLEDLDKRSYRIVPRNDRKNIEAHWERWDVAAGQWVTDTPLDNLHTIRHTYQDEQGTLGYGRALREALGWVWYTKVHIFQESQQSVERFAQGLVHVKVNGARDAETQKPNSAVIQEWLTTISNMMARHVLVTDEADSVEIIGGNATGWELMKDLRTELRGAAITLVLCANLPTSANEGGSYALGEIQENSTEALVQFDRQALEETLTDHLMECVWWNNQANLRELGIADEKPLFNVKQEKKIDPKERADVANVLHGMGVALAKEDVYEQTGFRAPQEGEEIIAGAVAPSPMAGMGLGGGFPPEGQP